MKYAALLLFLSIPSQAFSQSSWHREDKIASRIKGVVNVEHLVKSIDSSWREEKWSQIRIAFKWIEGNIKYDWAKYRKGGIRGYSPDETMTKRRGVCSDYARLFKCVLDSLGFENEVVVGNAKGYGYQQGDAFYFPDQAWNAVKDEFGKWHLFDVTWGSFYFDLDPEIMIYDHLPLDSDWQLMDSVVSKRKFEAISIRPKWFIQQGVALDQIKAACPSDECEFAEVFKIPETFDFDACEIPLLKNLKLGRRYTIILRGGKNIRFLLKNGFRTKQFVYADGTHSISFVAVRPFSSVSLLVEKRTPWTFLKWKT
jgi:hypothetical protein